MVPTITARMLRNSGSIHPGEYLLDKITQYDTSIYIVPHHLPDGSVNEVRIESFEQLLQHLSEETGKSYKWVQHFLEGREALTEEVAKKLNGIFNYTVSDLMQIQTSHDTWLKENRSRSTEMLERWNRASEALDKLGDLGRRMICSVAKAFK